MNIIKVSLKEWTELFHHNKTLTLSDFEKILGKNNSRFLLIKNALHKNFEFTIENNGMDNADFPHLTVNYENI